MNAGPWVNKCNKKICKGDRSVVHGKLKVGRKQPEVRSQRPDSSETGGKFKFLPQRGDDTNASAPRHHKYKCIDNCAEIVTVEVTLANVNEAGSYRLNTETHRQTETQTQ